MVAADGALRGLIAVSDTIKPGSYLAVRELGRMGVDTVMVTGDNRKTAEAVAGEIGIHNVISEVLPGDKADIVSEFRRKGRGGLCWRWYK